MHTKSAFFYLFLWTKFITKECEKKFGCVSTACVHGETTMVTARNQSNQRSSVHRVQCRALVAAFTTALQRFSSNLIFLCVTTCVKLLVRVASKEIVVLPNLSIIILLIASN